MTYFVDSHDRTKGSWPKADISESEFLRIYNEFGVAVAEQGGHDFWGARERAAGRAFCFTHGPDADRLPRVTVTAVGHLVVKTIARLLIAALFFGAAAPLCRPVLASSHRPELEYLEAVNRTSPPGDPQLLYDDLYEIYRGLYPALKPSYKRLSQFRAEAALAEKGVESDRFRADTRAGAR